MIIVAENAVFRSTYELNSTLNEMPHCQSGNTLRGWETLSVWEYSEGQGEWGYCQSGNTLRGRGTLSVWEYSEGEGEGGQILP